MVCLAAVRGRIRLSAPLPILLLHVFAAVLLLSLLWSSDTASTFRKGIFFLSLIPAAWMMVAASTQQRTAVLEAFVSGAAWAALLALAVQGVMLLMPDAGVAPFAPVLSWRVGAGAAEAVQQFPSWFVNIAGTTVPRATFPFPNPHTAVLYWAMALPYAMLSRRLPIRRAALLFAILTSFTRSGYALLLLEAPLIAVMLLRARKTHSPATVTFPKLWATGAVGGAALLLLPLFITRFLGSFDFAEGSLTGRLALWSDTLRIAVAAPLLGIGFGGLAVALAPLAGYRTPTNAHSSYLELLSETGVVGLLLFCTILISGVLLAGRQWQRGSHIHGAIAIALLAFGFHGAFETNLFGVETMAIFISLVALAGLTLTPKTWK